MLPSYADIYLGLSPTTDPDIWIDMDELLLYAEGCLFKQTTQVEDDFMAWKLDVSVKKQENIKNWIRYVCNSFAG